MRKRVIFLTHPSIFSVPVLQHLLANPEVDVVGIIHSSVVKTRGQSRLIDILSLLKQSGIRYTSGLGIATSFYQIAASLTNKPTTKKLAKKNNIPVLSSKDVNDVKTQAFIKSLKTDLGVCAYFNQLIKPDVLSLPTNGFINIHPSLLPHNKGVDPMFYATLRKEKSLGVSIHKMSEHIDEGEIYAQGTMDYIEDRSLMYNNFKLFELGSQLSIDVLKQYGKALPIAQQTKGNYDSWPKRNVCKQVNKLIPVKDILHLLRRIQ